MTACPLERIANNAQKIATVSSRLKQPIKGGVMEDIESLSNVYLELVKQSVDYLFDANASLANQIIDGIESVYMQVEELRAFALKLESHEVMVSLGTIVDSLSRIGDLGSNIAEIAINSTIRDK